VNDAFAEEQAVVFQVTGKVIYENFRSDKFTLDLLLVPNDKQKELCLALTVVGCTGLSAPGVCYVLNKVTLHNDLVPGELFQQCPLLLFVEIYVLLILLMCLHFLSNAFKILLTSTCKSLRYGNWCISWYIFVYLIHSC